MKNYAKVILSAGWPNHQTCRVIGKLDKAWRDLNHDKRVVVETFRYERVLPSGAKKIEESQLVFLRYDRIDQLKIDLSVNPLTERKRKYVERTIAR
jgi:hypothetical protein